MITLSWFDILLIILVPIFAHDVWILMGILGARTRLKQTKGVWDV